jgi:hypothetical protein
MDEARLIPDMIFTKLSVASINSNVSSTYFMEFCSDWMIGEEMKKRSAGLEWREMIRIPVLNSPE